MKLSEQVDKLLPALAAIQNRVEVKKNKTNPHHKNRYADLEAVVDACLPELDSQGLMFLQTLDDENIQPGQVLIITRIFHLKSGQWVESRLRMDARAATPQDLGSAITYGRRYSLVTALGLTPEDDDGNKAMPKPPVQKAPEPAKPAMDKKVSDLANLIVEACKLACLTPEQVREITGLPSIKETAEKGDAAALAQAWNKVQVYLQKKGAA
jgi:hypothetical protein